MKIKAIKISAITALIAASFPVSGQTVKETNDAGRELPQRTWASRAQQEGYETFKSFFPDVVFGKDGNTDRKRIEGTALKFYFDIDDDSDNETEERIYAVAKIIGHRGFDLFIVDHEYERPDEDSYDNHVDGLRELWIFKNNKRIADGPSYRLNIHYYGEGGESQRQGWFDRDTTLVVHNFISDVVHNFISERESATGYDTPIESTVESRLKLNEKGEMELIEIMRMEFSSHFYDRNFLAKNEAQWKREEKIYRSPYPGKENKWRQEINSSLELYFYVEDIDGHLTTVFESYDDGRLPLYSRTKDFYHRHKTEKWRYPKWDIELSRYHQNVRRGYRVTAGWKVYIQKINRQMTAGTKISKLFLRTTSLVTICIDGFLSFINLREFYVVAILGQTEGYPFGGEGPVPCYYKTAALYSTINMIWGCIFLLALYFAVWVAIKEQKRGVPLIFAATVLLSLAMFAQGLIGYE